MPFRLMLQPFTRWRSLHANRWLLTDLLRGEWKFKGHVVSDWFATAIIHTLHRVGATRPDAGLKAISAGVDVELPVTDCFLKLREQVKSGALPMKILDRAVRRVLYAKFWVGLFDRPFVDTAKAKKYRDCAEHRLSPISRASPLFCSRMKRSFRSPRGQKPSPSSARMPMPRIWAPIRAPVRGS